MTRFNRFFFLSACLALLGISCDSSDSSAQTPPAENLSPVAIEKTNPMKLYVHYMPWFETKESNGGQWGYHWTMNNRNPDIVDSNGKRQIASHYYPLIGPYHSGDRDVIENHMLMMKYSGIDGILIDWYGSFDLNDYKSNKDNSEQIIAMCDKVGLKYAIVYEDRTTAPVVNAGLAGNKAVAARIDMNYMRNNYFSDDSYITVNGRPLLLNFGPIELLQEADWMTAFSGLSTPPAFYTLWDHDHYAGSLASGEYAWVQTNNAFLADFYQNKMPLLPDAIGSAYPGFVDFYAEGGTPTVIGFSIPHNNGNTLAETLQLSADANVDMLQLVTWNDFGEGTMIEPTEEFGYDYLNQIRTFAGVQQADVFASISRLFELRKQYGNNASVKAKLDKAFGYFTSMQPQKAIQELDSI